jgi:hypothetical protein
LIQPLGSHSRTRLTPDARAPTSCLGFFGWVGDADLVDYLLAPGATVEGAAGWAAHGSRHHRRGDHVAVLERLVAAGAELEPSLLAEADAPLDEWLLDRVS